MEKRISLKVLFYIKRTKLIKNGNAPIYLRITVNKTKSEISLNRSIDPKLWNIDKNKVSGSTKVARQLNDYMEIIKFQVYEQLNILRENGKDIDAKSVLRSFLGIKDDEKTVLSIFEDHNNNIKKLEGIDYSSETIQRYETSLMHTRNFIKSKYNEEDLPLSSLDHNFVTNYEIYFKVERSCSHNTTMKYLKNFKKIIRIAIANGWLKQDPFANYKMTLKKVDRGFLTDIELQKLMSKVFTIERLDQVRDCFLFSCFTGLAHSDLKRLTLDNIVIGSDGKKWIKIKRKKTDNQSSIPLLSVTKQLIEKYKDNPSCIFNNVLLPVVSNQKMNAYLKEIADLCGIKQRMSSIWPDIHLLQLLH